MNKEGMKGYRMSDCAGGAGGRHRELKVRSSSSSSCSYLFDASNCSSIHRRVVFFADDNDDHNNTVMTLTPHKKISGKQGSKTMTKEKKKTPAKKTNTSVDSIFRKCISSPMNVLKTSTTTLLGNSSNTVATTTKATTNSSSFTILLHHQWKSFWIDQRRLDTTKQLMRKHKKSRGEVWRYHFTKKPTAVSTMKRVKQHEKGYPLLLLSSPIQGHDPKIPRMIQIQNITNGFIKPTNSTTNNVTMKKPSYNGSTTTNKMMDGRIVSGTDLIPTIKQKRRMNVTIDTDIGQLYDDTGVIVLSLSKEWPPHPSTTTSSSSSAVRNKPYHPYRSQHYKRGIAATTNASSNHSKFNVMKMNNSRELSKIQGIVYQQITTLPSFDSNIKEILSRHHLKNTFTLSLLHTGYVLQILTVTDDNNNNNDDSCFELKKRHQHESNNKTKKMISEPVLI